jgi:vacuolar-type H+-ATPase subunit I/STV1
LDKVDARLDELEARGQKISADLQSNYETQLQNFRQRRDELRERLAEVQKTGQETWMNIRREIEVARAALEAGIEEFRSQYREGE